MQSLNKAHKEEIKKLMQQIHSRSDNTFSKLKQAALVCDIIMMSSFVHDKLHTQDAVNTPSPKLPTEQQVTKHILITVHVTS